MTSEYIEFDQKKLKYALKQPMGAFNQYGQVKMIGGRRHIYIDRGSNVLGVAHSDSVQRYAGYSLGRERLHCATLDNRLGLYLVLYHLPMLGINCDVLITDMEECANSTAQDFVADKEYNWMFSFDRQGDDVVLYQYDDDPTRALLTSYGFEVDYGSYSDISDLGHLGCIGMNLGCGMHNYHSKDAYAELAELEMNLSLFANFYADMRDTHLAYVEIPGARYSRYSHWGNEWEYSSHWRTRDYTATSYSYKSPILVNGVKYFWDSLDKRYQAWDVETRTWAYLYEDQTGSVAETKTDWYDYIQCDGCQYHYEEKRVVLFNGKYLCDNCLVSAEDRDAQREFWDWEEGSAKTILACDACKRRFQSVELWAADGFTLCDECYEAEKGKTGNSEIVLTACDGCGEMLAQDRLTKLWDSQVCDLCFTEYTDWYKRKTKVRARM